MDLRFSDTIMKSQYTEKRETLSEVMMDVIQDDTTKTFDGIIVMLEDSDSLQVLEGHDADEGVYIFKMDFDKVLRNVEQQFLTCLGILISLRCKDKGEGYAIKHTVDIVYKCGRCL